MAILTILAIGSSVRDPATPTIFSPSSTPAHSIYDLALFVLVVTAVIFALVFSLVVYAVIKFRRRAGDDGGEPPQIYGNQVESAWTVNPVLIVVVLFLATARVIHASEDAKFSPGTSEITADGHQFWLAFRCPSATYPGCTWRWEQTAVLGLKHS